MTKEQTNALWKAIERYRVTGYECGSSLDLAEYKERKVKDDAAKKQVRDLLLRYTGHEVT